MSRSDVPERLRAWVADRDVWRCSYCHLSQVGQATRVRIDHIWPWSSGGPTAADNHAFQCTGCSLHDSDRIEMADPLTERLTPLFHPLRPSWPDRFATGGDGVCHGLRDVGRATVVALGMNEDAARVARRLQVASGLLAAAEDWP